MHPVRRRAIAWIGLACFGLLAGCSGGDSGDRASRDRPNIDGASVSALRPIAPPDGFAEVRGEGFTIAAPPGFTPDRGTSSRNGEPTLVLNGPQGDGALVGVVRDVNPPSDALTQAMVLEDKTRLVDRATDVRRDEIDWPGAEQAVMVQWTAPDSRQSTGPQPFRTLQLVAQVNKELILSVVATAPAASFDQSQVATVLRTFRPRAAAS